MYNTLHRIKNSLEKKNISHWVPAKSKIIYNYNINNYLVSKFLSHTLLSITIDIKLSLKPYIIF